MEILRDRERGDLFLCQMSYLKRVLLRFNMSEAKQVTTPFGQHLKLSTEQSPNTDVQKQEMQKIPYVSAVGSLMYGMVCSRPDLAYAVSVISRFMANPGKSHWEAPKWTLRYLKGASNVGLMFKKQDDVTQPVVGYVDSDFAGNLDTRKSLTGFVFTMYGTTISWKANLQSVVALH